MDNIKKTIIEELKDFKSEFIYIFGSFASGQINSESDIDIAFYSFEKIEKYEVFQKAQEISFKLKREIDLIDLKESSTVFQNQVIEKGIVIFEKNSIEREKFELLVMKKYLELNKLRKDLIDNYENDLDSFIDSLK